ncbi:MAG: triose-phosphate isomerase [Candidatus Pacebacteria bacterium]|nr:triose-phosphate isomerase [Candidatus Paceibacterota bacterium]
MIFVNFKTYQQGTGAKASKLAEICEKVSKKTGETVILVAQASDIFRLSRAVSLPVWAQDVDEINYGSHTGWILPEAIKDSGAKGAILNHSEKRRSPEAVGKIVRRLKDLNLKSLLCCQSIDEGQKLVKFQPDFLAYEPAELIGSCEVSVASAKPETIRNFVLKFSRLPVVVGAGIHSPEDVKLSLRLGAKGILVATDVVLARNPQKELAELAQAFG